MWRSDPHFSPVLKQTQSIPKRTCVVCQQHVPRSLLRKIEGEYICESCWAEMAKEVLDRLVKEELRKKGIFNPTAR